MSQTYIDAAAHGFSSGDPIVFSNLEGGQGIVQGQVYFVIAAGLTSDIFQFSETVGGAAFAFDTPITSGNVAAWPTYSVETGIMSPPDTPDAPTGLTVTTFLTTDADGHQHSVVAADLVHDTTEGVSGAVVEATWTDAGGSTPDWAKKAVINLPLGTLRASFTVPGNLTVWVRAYAVTVYGGTSAYTSVDSVTSAKDTTAPAVPTGLAAVGGILGIAAKWDANAELDLAYYEFQWDDNSGFTSPETKQFKGNLAVITGLAEGTWYFKVRAVDTSGNASAYTSSANAASRLTGTSDLDPTAVINQATNLINGTANVTIDDDGLHIEDGALFLKDEFGETVLVASGFSGAWRTFIALGLYNADFDAGVLGTLPNGRTASLPYWTLSTVVGSPVLALVDSVSSPGEQYLKFSWAANGNKKRIVSDPVPVSILSDVAYGVLHFGSGTSTQTVEVVIEYSDDLVSWSSGDSTSGVAGPLNTKQEGVSTASAHFARLQITVDETTGHDAAAFVAIFTAWLRPAPTIASSLRVETTLTVDNPAGAGLGEIELDGMLRIGGDVGLGRSAAGVLELDDGTGVTPGSGGSADLVVQGSVAAAQDGTDDAFVVGDDAIIFDADTADALGIKGQQTAANGKIVFGSGKDTNLYRSAANELKTDDSFVVSEFLRGGGTSFPASPATDDRYYRTDKGLWFHYDGTLWLSDMIFTIQMDGGRISATNADLAGAAIALKGGSDIYIEDVVFAYYIGGGGSALSASHKWNIVLNKGVAASSSLTSITTLAISSGSSQQSRSSTNTIGALMNNGTSHLRLNLGATKTGTPGDLILQVEMRTRLVAT